MKTTKRILAMITALVLCLAPMALMVGAATTHETHIMPLAADYPCPNCGRDYYAVDSLPEPSRIVYKHTGNVCYTVYYAYANMKCHYCNYKGTLYEECSRDVTHPTLIYRTETVHGISVTAYHCPSCNYYRY